MRVAGPLTTFYGTANHTRIQLDDLEGKEIYSCASKKRADTEKTPDQDYL